MARTPACTRDRLLVLLRRRGGRTVTQIARELRVSTVAVRQHVAALEAEGMVRCGPPLPSRGRPARPILLTEAARGRFPDGNGPLALELLEEVEALGGRELVLEALRRRARRLSREWKASFAGKPLAERVRLLADIRDRDGYLAAAERRGPRGAAAPDLVERHCPIAAVARRWPEVCAIEEEMVRDALGATVVRTEHQATGGTCCRYTTGGGGPAEV